MGLIGGIARTAVVAGTFTAVSNRVSRRQAKRWAQKDQSAYPPQQYVTALQQCGDFLRLERGGVVVPAEGAIWRQQVVEMAHQRADTKDAVDAGQVPGQPDMIGGRVGAELQHVAHDGDAPA